MNKNDWIHFGKMLSNENRLEILRMLWAGDSLTVTDITDALDISFKSTSRHLNILEKKGYLTRKGKKNHVYYDYNEEMPTELWAALRIVMDDLVA